MENLTLFPLYQTTCFFIPLVAPCTPLLPSDMHYETLYYGEGYEKPTKEATEAIWYLARKEGIIVDPVYTGKAFAGMLDCIRKGIIPKGSTVVFWHTGGATGLFAEQEIVGDIWK